MTEGKHIKSHTARASRSGPASSKPAARRPDKEPARPPCAAPPAAAPVATAEGVSANPLPLPSRSSPPDLLLLRRAPRQRQPSCHGERQARHRRSRVTRNLVSRRRCKGSGLCPSLPLPCLHHALSAPYPGTKGACARNLYTLVPREKGTSFHFQPAGQPSKTAPPP
jgi:hypothetical protein